MGLGAGCRRYRRCCIQPRVRGDCRSRWPPQALAWRVYSALRHRNGAAVVRLPQCLFGPLGVDVRCPGQRCVRIHHGVLQRDVAGDRTDEPCWTGFGLGLGSWLCRRSRGARALPRRLRSDRHALVWTVEIGSGKYPRGRVAGRCLVRGFLGTAVPFYTRQTVNRTFAYGIGSRGSRGTGGNGPAGAAVRQHPAIPDRPHAVHRRSGDIVRVRRHLRGRDLRDGTRRGDHVRHRAERHGGPRGRRLRVA